MYLTRCLQFLYVKYIEIFLIKRIEESLLYEEFGY